MCVSTITSWQCRAVPVFPISFRAAVWRARSRHRANACPPTSLTRRHRRRDAAEIVVTADRHQPPLAAPLCLPHQTGSTHGMCKRRIRSKRLAHRRLVRTPRQRLPSRHYRCTRFTLGFSVWVLRTVRGAFHHEVSLYFYPLPHEWYRKLVCNDWVCLA